MSYRDFDSEWTVYKEDCRPELSHLYHDTCKIKLGISGDVYSVHFYNSKPSHCVECGKKVPVEVIQFWEKICREERQ